MSEPQKPQKPESKTESEQKDCSIERVFLANDVLPNAADAFVERIGSIEDAIKTADIVLDTNVLLLPYGAGASSLKEIVAIFKHLKEKRRLFLPAQVAREFVKNRPNKLSELQHGLAEKIGKYVGMEKLSFPILEGVEEYQQINEAIKNNTELKKTHAALLRKIRLWEWNDPVNTAYRDVFTADTIVEPQCNREATLAELLKRQRLLIPPGYKDSAKDDLGIGDFLIWKTILEIGAKNKKGIIFVSGDEKADWQHRADGVGFLPRYELVDEFRRASSGSSFYIVSLSTLLELLKVKSTSVDEIKKEETRIQQATNVAVDCPFCRVEVQCYLGEYVNSSALPICKACSNKFHVHRTAQGIITRKSHLPTEAEIESDKPVLERVACPNCKTEIEELLGTYVGATRQCRCDTCGAMFSIHRIEGGGIRVGSFRLRG
ncbi:MAG: PIN domain-containing protein [Verrucomicrobiota bacterium]|jgi:hypothetical protein